MRTLYFDCFSGASGNMILGALIALGVDLDELETELARLNLPGVALKYETVDRSGICGIHVEVRAPDQNEHRHLADIEKIIEASGLSDYVKNLSTRIFTRLAQAEAKVHGIAIEKVHFHEVGALDAIVDIVGACICFQRLGVERFACSKIHVGSGFVLIAHGKFPIPPPAVAELLAGAPIYSTEIEGELITPTAAAIISTVCDAYGSIPEMTVERTGYGAGTRTYKDFPNVLRLMLGVASELPTADNIEADQLVLIETNLDDVSPQVLGYVMERAFEIGALDCWFTPIQMKKNRPATMISLLGVKEQREVLTDLLYSETTTLGIRVREIERECLQREVVKVPTRYGAIDVKIARHKGKVVNTMPEYEQMRKLARENNLPLKDIEKEVRAELEKERLTASATE